MSLSEEWSELGVANVAALHLAALQPGAAADRMDPLKDQPQIITTTICPTRSVLTDPDGPGRRIEIDVRSANTTCLPRRAPTRPTST
jgi:hypothetical protein